MSVLHGQSVASVVVAPGTRPMSLVKGANHCVIRERKPRQDQCKRRLNWLGMLLPGGGQTLSDGSATRQGTARQDQSTITSVRDLFGLSIAWTVLEENCVFPSCTSM